MRVTPVITLIITYSVFKNEPLETQLLNQLASVLLSFMSEEKLNMSF